MAMDRTAEPAKDKFAISDLDPAHRLELALDAGSVMGAWTWDVANDRFVADERFARTFDLDPAACAQGIAPSFVMHLIVDEDRRAVSAAIQAALIQGGPYRREYRIVTGGETRWVEANGMVELDPATGEALKFAGFLVDIDGRRRAQDELAKANALLRAFMQAVPQVVYAKDRAGRMLMANRGVTELIGQPYEAIIGRTDAEFLGKPDEAAVIMANDRKVMESGETQQIEEQVSYPDGRLAWWHSTKAPLLDEANEVIGLIGASIDITAQRQAAEQRDLLLNELNHRVKNIWAIVQSVASQSFRQGVDYAAARREFDGRIASMARAHDLLTEDRWMGADLADVVKAQLDVLQAGDRIHSGGPPVAINARAALSLNLALHELATNALKYGALSNNSGQVLITWELDSDTGALLFRWEERLGPVVAPPSRKGFGSRLIERVLMAEFGGKVHMDYAPTGLICTVTSVAPVAATR